MEPLTNTSRASKGPGTTVVIVTYNSADVLSGLLDSLAPGFEGAGDYAVVVVDNDSRDESVRIAREHPVGAQVIATGRNAGYAAGINVATRVIARNRHVLVLNPDIRLAPGSVALLLKQLAISGAGVVAPKIVGEEGELALSLRREPSLLSAWSDAVLGGSLATRLGIGEIVGPSTIYERGGSVEWATGAYLLISADARRLVGEWDEGFFLYSEEVDYLRRVREQGLTVLYVPEATAIHIGGEHKVVSRLYALLTANRIRYYRRYHGPIATLLFRLGVMAGEGLRAGQGAVHRAGLRAAFTPTGTPGALTQS